MPSPYMLTNLQSRRRDLYQRPGAGTQANHVGEDNDAKDKYPEVDAGHGPQVHRGQDTLRNTVNYGLFTQNKYLSGGYKDVDQAKGQQEFPCEVHHLVDSQSRQGGPYP